MCLCPFSLCTNIENMCLGPGSGSGSPGLGFRSGSRVDPGSGVPAWSYFKGHSDKHTLLFVCLGLNHAGNMQVDIYIYIYPS